MNFIIILILGASVTVNALPEEILTDPSKQENNEEALVKAVIYTTDAGDKIENNSSSEDFQGDNPDHINREIGLQDANYFNAKEDFALMKESDFYFKDIVSKHPDEIMDTAGGFVPIPILRRKHKQWPRKQFANRRYFKRPRPYRPIYFFYPYYRYHYPGSLRFY